MTNLPVHPTLTHPRTGEPLRAIYRTRAGQLVWPQLGGDGTGDPPADPPAPPTDPPPTGPADPPPDEPLGPPGIKALQEEREARKALERQIAELAPLRKLAEAFGAGTPTAGGKSEVELLSERFAEHERQLGEERQARWRAEVAAEKGLTPAQAARLRGGTREELVADADDLLTLFPAAPAQPTHPAGPRPDPSQGSRGNTPAARPTSLGQAVTEALKPRA
jgi:hypothetical protein